MGSLWHPFSDMAAVREHEFVVDRAEGAWVYDEQGRAYLDGCASLWYANVGHGRTVEVAVRLHPAVVHHGRVVDGRGQFALRDQRRVPHRIPDAAVHLRRAP